MYHKCTIHVVHQVGLEIIRALSEVVGTPLPYDDIPSLRDRLWEALAGLKSLVAATAGAKTSGQAFKKPVTNFYQTDPISRASATIAQCTRAFVKGDKDEFDLGQT